MSRRKLDVGADGKANVLLLTDPIPRHLSLVSWGANDRPATSWKSAESPHKVLRSSPGMQAIDIGGLSLQRVQHFVNETLDAWSSVIQDVLATPLSSAERASRIQGHTSQAGARIAAFTTAVAPRLAHATASYKTIDLSLPAPPDSSTLQGEIDRRHFVAGIEQASAAVLDRVVSFMRDSEGKSPTEAILGLFSEVGGVFSKWASTMPAGVVGISSASVSEKSRPNTEKDSSVTNTKKSADVTMNAGSRNNKADKAKLSQVLSIVQDILGTEEPSTEKSMTITLEDLKTIAGQDPVGFLNVLNDALASAKQIAPAEAKKFMWGDTGVEPHSVESIMGPLRDMIASDALAGLIASAVGGVDVNAAASGDSPQVAATMRDAFGKVLASELTKNPNGTLALAVKSAVAPSMAEAIRRSLEAIVSGSAPTGEMGAFGLGGFQVSDDEDPLKVELPSLHKPV